MDTYMDTYIHTITLWALLIFQFIYSQRKKQLI